MADHPAEQATTMNFEPAESAFRRIARRKLLERGYPDEAIEAKIDQLLRTGVPGLRFDTDGILGREQGPD